MVKSHEFEKRIPEILPEIVDALQTLGDEAITAYNSVELRHNTLNKFVDTILSDGLTPESDDATPDAEDIEVAKRFFQSKGVWTPDKDRKFSRSIEGKPAYQAPGVYFYGVAEGSTVPNNHYGIPERILILAQEMGFVMMSKDGSFSEEERTKAREIYDKYRGIIYGDPDTHISVIGVDPFSPNIVNTRLSNLPYALRVQSREEIINALKLLDLGEFHGIYIPGSIPSSDIELLDVQLPLTPSADYLNLENLDPSKSRFM